MLRHPLKFISMRGVPIFRQLIIEEWLLRCTKDNYLIINTEMPGPPAIVLGFSGKIKELVNVEAAARDRISLIRRYTGGGTVICDSSTIFVSFIINQSDATTKPYPREIMTWTTDNIYNSLFLKHYPSNKFSLRENDYVFGDLKFGGNAQTITRDRWVHHTSFLWDYDPRNMEYLQLPKKQPAYRLDRDHTCFLTKLKTYIPSIEVFENGIKGELEKIFTIEEFSASECDALVNSLRVSFDEAVICRTKLESAELVLRDMLAVPTLVKTGPSCVNL